MSDASINILIGGEAGQGLVTIGQLMSKALVRTGYEIIVDQEYLSRVRGGHNWFAIRTGPEPVLSPVEAVDILVALDGTTIDVHKDKLTDRAIVLADAKLECKNLNSLSIPFEELTPKVMLHNTVALGVLGALVCVELDVLERLMADNFGKKGDEVVNENIEVLRKSYAWVGERDSRFECLAPPPEDMPERMMLNGNEAIALGALAAGCNFCSFYPMTPATTVPLTLINAGKALNFVGEQAEDEIAAVNMALGASYAGARALVATSGGGFALMEEGVSLAGITETPLVIVLAQRPGPATGLPTRTEQADLNLALYSGHGEFPRAVFAPGDLEECFYLTHRAFDMTEKYQTPVFVLTDKFLADSYRGVVPFNLDELPEVAAPILEPDDPAGYKRYAVTEDGVSPRVVPGFSEALVRVDSDEHTEEGFIAEDQETRIAQNEKRLRKGAGLLEETVPPELFGEDGADLLLLCWGSTLGPALEAMQRLNASGTDTSVLHFKQLWPLKDDQFVPFLEEAGRVVGIEGNATGQFARLLRQETGFHITDLVLRHDGFPFTPAYILECLEDIL